MLLPSEQEAMLKLLEGAKIPIKPIKMNPQKQQPVTGSLQALLSKDPALKVTQCSRLHWNLPALASAVEECCTSASYSGFLCRKSKHKIYYISCAPLCTHPQG